MKNLLVTGGCGFIGSNFVRLCLERCPNVRLVNLDKLTYAGNLENLADIASDPRYRFVKGDICDAKAVEGVEAKPDSAGRKATLEEEVASAKADQDAELLKAAQALLEKLNAQPGGAQIIQQATGSYIAQASGGSTATVNVNVPKP